MSIRRDKSLDALWPAYELPLWVLRREFGIADDDRKGWQKLALMLAVKHQPKNLLLSPRKQLAYLLATSSLPPITRPRGRPPKGQKPETPPQVPRLPGRPQKYSTEHAQRSLDKVESVKSRLKRQGKRATAKDAVLWIIRDMSKQEGTPVSDREARNIAEEYSKKILPHLRRIIKRSKSADSC